MRIKKPENPNVFVKALKHGGFDEHKLNNGWTLLENPSDSGVVLAVPMDQPLQAEKIESYLRAAKLSEETYEQWKFKFLKDHSR